MAASEPASDTPKKASMLMVFREMRKKKGEKGEEKPKDEGGSPSYPPADKATFGDFHRAADALDAAVGAADGGAAEGAPAEEAGESAEAEAGEAGMEGEPAASSPAAIVAKEAGIPEEDAQRLLDAAKKLPAVADLDPAALGKRLRDDFDLRMKLESIAARPERAEREGPVPFKLGGGM